MNQIWIRIEQLIADLRNNADSEEDGRAKALTLTKLEEASFWASKIQQGEE
jgi:hypothetical protein